MLTFPPHITEPRAPQSPLVTWAQSTSENAPPELHLFSNYISAELKVTFKMHRTDCRSRRRGGFCALTNHREEGRRGGDNFLQLTLVGMQCIHIFSYSGGRKKGGLVCRRLINCINQQQGCMQPVTDKQGERFSHSSASISIS